MRLVDTHCHIHESEFFDYDKQSEAYENAIKSDIGMICVATSEKASREAIKFVSDHDKTWAVIGVHPHETNTGIDQIQDLLSENHEKLVGVGEIGLDYFYMNSDRTTQINALEQQLQWATDYSLPVSFHVRDFKKAGTNSVWDDFWPIFDNFPGLKGGVLHSFTDNSKNLEQALSRRLYIGVNGIATFAHDRQDIYRQIPLDKMLLETDAPFLTPAPFRGKMNEPKYVGRVAEHMACLFDVSLDELEKATTNNAKRLFTI